MQSFLFSFLFLVGYAGLFRISELLSVKIKDITIVHDVTSIFVSKRKNDQNREGHSSIIARSGKVSYPVSITERLLVLLASPKESCSPVLRRIVRTKNGAYFHKSLGISYSTNHDDFKKYVSPFVNDPTDYCLHSLKSGGASNDSYKLSDPELKDGRILALRGVTPSVVMLRCLKLLKVWVFLASRGFEFVSWLHPGFPFPLVRVV